MAGHWNGESFSLQELHRFSNGGVAIGQDLYWNALGLWSQMQEGLRKYRALFHDSPSGIAVDAWGVDFGLLDSKGRLMGNPVHYRDCRTNGMPECLFGIVPEAEIFAETGTHTMAINTLFQLYSMVKTNDVQIQYAETMLMIPDLFHYFLGGEKKSEFTEATTTQMYSLLRGRWANEMLARVGIPARLLPEIISPGSLLSEVRPEVLRGCGFDTTFPVVAVGSHDTASAVAAVPHMDDDSAFISSGTWSLMGVQATEPNTSQKALDLGFTNEAGADGHVLLLKNITGLWILQECLQQWKLEGRDYTLDEILRAAEQAKPVRSIFDPDNKKLHAPGGMVQGIQSCCRESRQPIPETVGEIARAAFESLSLKFRSTLGLLEELTGRELKTIRIVGGGSRNALLSQMIADACNRLVITGPVEASALGNIVVQAVATGDLPDMQSGKLAVAASVQCGSYDPHPSAAWDDAYTLFNMIEAA